MNCKLPLILASASMIAMWSEAQNRESTPGKGAEFAEDKSKLLSGAAVYGWLTGVIERRENEWYIRTDSKFSSDSAQTDVRMFPYDTFVLYFEIQGGEAPDIARMRAKDERDGHQFSVGIPGCWFGRFCENEKDFDDYSRLIYALKLQLRFDPPGVKPAFKGAGFYVITEHLSGLCR